MNTITYNVAMFPYDRLSKVKEELKACGIATDVTGSIMNRELHLYIAQRGDWKELLEDTFKAGVLVGQILFTDI